MFIDIIEDLIAGFNQFVDIGVELRIVDLLVDLDNVVERLGSVFNELLLQL